MKNRTACLVCWYIAESRISASQWAA